MPRQCSGVVDGSIDECARTFVHKLLSHLLGRFGWQFQFRFVRCFFGSNTFKMSAGTGTGNCTFRVGACWTAKLVFDFDQAPARPMSARDKVFRLHLIPRPQALVAND